MSWAIAGTSNLVPDAPTLKGGRGGVMNIFWPYIGISVSCGPVSSIALECLGTPLSQCTVTHENGCESLWGKPGRSAVVCTWCGVAGWQKWARAVPSYWESSLPASPSSLLDFCGMGRFGGTLTGCSFVLPPEMPFFRKHLYNPLQEGPSWLLLWPFSSLQ